MNAPTDPSSSSLPTPEELPDLPRGDEGPIFAEPWQAQAFGIVVNLVESGHCSWSEWAEMLGQQLKDAANAGRPDDGSHYYHHWVAALEQLLIQKNLVVGDELIERRQDWKDAYIGTPHGEPVELGS